MNVLHNRFLDLLFTRRFFNLLFNLLLLFVLMVTSSIALVNLVNRSYSIYNFSVVSKTTEGRISPGFRPLFIHEYEPIHVRI